jgi:hypothetical protein
MAHQPGGGAGSRQVVSKPVRTGGPNRGANVKGVSQIGESMGNHITESRKVLRNVPQAVFDGRAAIPSRLGNEIATNVGRGGPGAGRVVHRSGSQQTWGSVNPGNPPPRGGNLFPGWPAKK